MLAGNYDGLSEFFYSNIDTQKLCAIVGIADDWIEISFYDTRLDVW